MGQQHGMVSSPFPKTSISQVEATATGVWFIHDIAVLKDSLQSEWWWWIAEESKHMYDWLAGLRCFLKI